MGSRDRGREGGREGGRGKRVRGRIVGRAGKRVCTKGKKERREGGRESTSEMFHKVQYMIPDPLG